MTNEETGASKCAPRCSGKGCLKPCKTIGGVWAGCPFCVRCSGLIAKAVHRLYRTGRCVKIAREPTTSEGLVKNPDPSRTRDADKIKNRTRTITLTFYKNGYEQKADFVIKEACLYMGEFASEFGQRKTAFLASV